ncbi:MAG: ATP-dependent DNA ligase [Gammaproteobacteria bacterium]|nr:ATP-dependent DNA ligase [Gammaproteobacteria bacterium]
MAATKKNSTAGMPPDSGTLGQLVQTSQQVSANRGRLAKRELLASLFLALSDAEFPLAVYYLTGALAQGRIGLGYATLKSVLPVPPAAEGRLNLAQVDRQMRRFAAIKGAGSTVLRQDLLRELLQAATVEEQNFLTRLFCGELRQGALQGTVLEAVAEATQVPDALLRRALMLHGELAEVAQLARDGGTAALAAIAPTTFRPLQPMLADTAVSAHAAVQRHGTTLLEFKLDGARVQMHKRGAQIRVYSRRLNDVTSAVPEIVSLGERLGVEEAILDGETLALRGDGKPQPFQTTMRRFGRRLNVETMRSSLPLSVFFFDCMYLDGEDLTGLPTLERISRLRGFVQPTHLLPQLVTGDGIEARAFLARALAAGHEGILAKSTTAPYAAGSRGSDWLKVKPVHTLDLVVLAAEWGHGRRRGWLSNLHLGARDSASGEFVMLGKTFKGLTDEMLRWQTEVLQQLTVREEGNTVFVKPALVVEIACNDIQTSPQYPAGMTLRFARVKQYRSDKKPHEADTLETVRALHAQATQS